ncbi:MAG TPA: thiolase family protein [Thermoanaerobaculia bacterium]|nr:thiolase family protein [Thermoanaerobaculia bacterium]
MKNDNDIVLAAPVRTPIGKFLGSLSSLTAVELGTAAARAALERAGLDPQNVDQVIFGHGRQAGSGPNSGRQVAWRSGVPADRPAYTVNQACASGLQAVLSAARTILTGEARVVLAGGMESMSNTPYLLPRARTGYRLGNAEIVDAMYKDGFNCPLSELAMGETAEELAREVGIDRAASDAYALESQLRCERARTEGRFDSEIVPVTVSGKKGDVTISKDEHPRDGATLDSMTKLKPVFREDGVVTAGNASGITDGAAAIIVASRAAAKELGLPVVARLSGWHVVGVEPRIMGIGPVPAVRKVLEKAGLDIGAIDEVEINEAFAAQVLACNRELGIGTDRLNPDGGAIALGHPIGATGTRILVTLLHGLERRGGERGIATLCVSGGMGIAALVEREAAA